MSYTLYKGLTHERWLEGRSKGIGSSEAGTVLGLNPYDSPYMLWKRKTGRESAVKEENFAMKAGHYLEDAVARFFADETDNIIIKSSAGDWLAVDKDRPYLRVSPDRTYWLAGETKNKVNKGIVECKTTQRKIDKDNIPMMWYCQLQYQLGVMGLQHGALAWLISGRDFDYQLYDFDSNFYDFLTSKIEHFWCENVQKGIEPELTRVDDVIDKFKRQTEGKTVIATDDVLNAYRRLKDVKEQASEIKTQQTELEDVIKMYLQDGECLCDKYGNVLATWKQAKDSIKFDEKRFASEHKDEYEEYKKTVAGSRRLLIK